MDKQHLPNYIHKFLDYPYWRVHETRHYRFYFFPKSLAEKELNLIAETQERSFKKIISTLHIEVPRKKITHYFYPSKMIKKRLMGDDWYAQAIRAEFCVHSLYTKSIKPIGAHEDTHLLSLPWGISVGFFQEGLAEGLVGHAWDGTEHNDYVRVGFMKKIYPALTTFFEHDAWIKTNDGQAIYFYSLAGSFVGFLIQEFGIEKFKAFYIKSNRKNSLSVNRTAFEKIYGDFDRLEKLYKTHLGK